MDERSVIPRGEALLGAESILESISDAFVALDREWRYTYVNHRAELLLGFPKRELLGQNAWDVFSDDAFNSAKLNLARALEAGEPVTYELWYAPSESWLEVRAYPSENGIALYFLDITSRKQTEEALQAALRKASDVAAKRSAILSQIADGVIATDPQGHITIVNDAAERILGVRALGITPDRYVEAYNLFTLDGEPHPEADLPLARAALHGETVEDALWMVRRPDGAEIIVRGSACPVRAEDGTKISAVLTFRDVTAQLDLERKLRESEERYRSLFDSIDEGFCIIEVLFDDSGKPHDYRYLEVNPAFEKHTGIRNAAGETIRHFAPNLEHSWFEVTGEVALTGNPARFTKYAGALNRWFDVYAFRVGDSDSRNVAVLFEDITAQKQTEEALRERERELRKLNETLEHRVAERTAALSHTNHVLEQRNRELQDFAYAASHDLQEPLRKITTFAGLLRSDCGEQLDEMGQSYLARMEAAAARMSGLLRDLLSFSRVSTQGQPFRPVGLDAVLENVLSDLELSIQERSGIVEASPLPCIEADPAQIYQLLRHLIENAVKFHRPGTPPRIHISCDDVEESSGEASPALKAFCRITVEDNGIGFDEQYTERIFSPFQRLHGRGKYPGSGMGLAICRRIVERHGGGITAESRVGQGTRFIVTLPVRQHHPETQPD